MAIDSDVKNDSGAGDGSHKSGTESSNDEVSKKGSGIWSDLPRRITTLAFGLPLVCVILAQRTTSHLFFVAVHGLACWEWMTVLANPGPRSDGKIAYGQHGKFHPTNKVGGGNYSDTNYHQLSMAFLFCLVSLLLAWTRSDRLFQFLLCLISGTLMIGTVVVSSSGDACKIKKTQMNDYGTKL